jgi:hypothetical protein
MSALELPWSVAGMAGAGRAWLHAWFGRRGPRDRSPEDSRLVLEQRILATQTEIVAMHRSLAMHKHALDAAARAPRKPGDTPAQPGADKASAQKVDLPLDDEGLSCYAETRPMPFLDLRPRPEAATK